MRVWNRLLIWKRSNKVKKLCSSVRTIQDKEKLEKKGKLFNSFYCTNNAKALQMAPSWNLISILHSHWLLFLSFYKDGYLFLIQFFLPRLVLIDAVQGFPWNNGRLLVKFGESKSVEVAIWSRNQSWNVQCFRFILKKRKKERNSKAGKPFFYLLLNLILLKSNNTAFSPLTQPVPLIARKEDSVQCPGYNTGSLIDLSSGGLVNYLLSLRWGCNEIEFCSSSLIPR